MAFLVAILGALGVVAFFVIRANQAAKAARELGDLAADAKGFVRRNRWKSKANVDQLRDVEDARLAAAVMMCALAKSDGDLSEREVTAIQEQLTGPLALTAGEAEEMLAQARWLTPDMGDLNALLHRVISPIQANCTPTEKGDLLDMLGAAAAADGPIDAIQQNALDRLREDLGVSQR